MTNLYPIARFVMLATALLGAMFAAARLSGPVTWKELCVDSFCLLACVALAVVTTWNWPK